MEHNTQNHNNFEINKIKTIHELHYTHKKVKPNDFNHLDNNISTYKNTFDILEYYLKNTTNNLTIIKSEINYNQQYSKHIPATFNVQFNILFNNHNNEHNNEHTVYNFELLAHNNMFSVKTFSATQTQNSNPYNIKQTTNFIQPQIVNITGLQQIIIHIINYINKINEIHGVDINTDTTIKTQSPQFYAFASHD